MLSTCASTPLLAQLPGPRLQSVFPPGAKQGSTVEVEIAGGNLEEARKLYFSHAGITAEALPEDKGKPARFKVAVAASVPVGEFDVRAIGKHGISNPRTFVVSDFAEATEKEPNNQRTEASRVALNTTITGRRLVRKARGGVIVWDTVNTPAISRMTRSMVLAVRGQSPFALTASPAEFTVKKGEPLKLNVAVRRDATMPNAVDLSGAGTQLPPGLEIPLIKVAAGKTSAEFTLSTDKMPPGTFSFVINGDGQVPAPEGDKKNIRCVYPSNAVKVTIEPAAKP